MGGGTHQNTARNGPTRQIIHLRAHVIRATRRPFVYLVCNGHGPIKGSERNAILFLDNSNVHNTI